MSARTDRYPLRAPQSLRDRMKGCDQVHPKAARKALQDGLLVFGLSPDMKWRPVEFVVPHQYPDTGYSIVFAAPLKYVREFTRDGILLVEVPPV